MNATFSIAEPRKVRMTLEVSMTLQEWEELRKALPVEGAPNLEYWHPAVNLRRVIDDLVQKANKEFTPTARTPRRMRHDPLIPRTAHPSRLDTGDRCTRIHRIL